MKIYVRSGATDMRKSINGLATIVEHEMRLDPMAGYMFLFSSKNRKKIKILFWEKNGFWLWMKRLEERKYPWPKTDNDAILITNQEFSWLLNGIDFFNRHKLNSFALEKESKYLARIDTLEKKISELEEKLKIAEMYRFARKTEKMTAIDKTQSWLFNEAETVLWEPLKIKEKLYIN